MWERLHRTLLERLNAGGAIDWSAAVVVVERALDPKDLRFVVGLLRGRLAFRPGR
ncbi:MAG: hypothetical protein H0T96_08910 [Thermoleophilaceae bacterium]|nr:hypothetical protein [Thermoleophilaceae bacterium]